MLSTLEPNTLEREYLAAIAARIPHWDGKVLAAWVPMACSPKPAPGLQGDGCARHSWRVCLHIVWAYPFLFAVTFLLGGLGGSTAVESMSVPERTGALF